jgi:hypothetical protein
MVLASQTSHAAFAFISLGRKEIESEEKQEHSEFHNFEAVLLRENSECPLCLAGLGPRPIHWRDVVQDSSCRNLFWTRVGLTL